MGDLYNRHTTHWQILGVTWFAFPLQITPGNNRYPSLCKIAYEEVNIIHQDNILNKR